MTLKVILNFCVRCSLVHRNEQFGRSCPGTTGGPGMSLQRSTSTPGQTSLFFFFCPIYIFITIFALARAEEHASAWDAMAIE